MDFKDNVDRNTDDILKYLDTIDRSSFTIDNLLNLCKGDKEEVYAAIKSLIAARSIHKDSKNSTISYVYGDIYHVGVDKSEGSISIGKNAVANTRTQSKILQNSKYDNLDRQLFERIRELLNRGDAIDYIRKHDFGGAAQADSIDALYSLNTFISNNPTILFFNEELEDLRKKLADEILKFIDIIGIFSVREGHLYKVDTKNRNAVFSSDTPENRELNREFNKNVEDLNKIADEIVKVYDNLVKLARTVL